LIHLAIGFTQIEPRHSFADVPMNMVMFVIIMVHSHFQGKPVEQVPSAANAVEVANGVSNSTNEKKHSFLNILASKYRE
jgi:hypothetical protein